MSASATDILPRISAPRPLAPAGMDGLLERAKLLDADDRLLLESTFVHNLSLRQIARLAGRNAGALSRTVKRLIRQLNHPTALAMLDVRCPLAQPLKQIGVERFLIGMTARQIAEKHEMPLRAVRKSIASIEMWMLLRSSGRM